MSGEDDTSWLSPMLRMRQVIICCPPNGRRIVYSGLADLADNCDHDGDIHTINAIGEVRPKLPTPTTRAKSNLPRGAARSGFSCGRSQRPRYKRGPEFNSLGPSFCLYSPECVEYDSLLKKILLGSNCVSRDAFGHHETRDVRLRAVGGRLPVPVSSGL
jgi:hypothetical protein